MTILPVNTKDAELEIPQLDLTKGNPESKPKIKKKKENNYDNRHSSSDDNEQSDNSSSEEEKINTNSKNLQENEEDEKDNQEGKYGIPLSLIVAIKKVIMVYRLRAVKRD